MKKALLSTVALLALNASALAGGSHANPDYPSPAAMSRAGVNVNLGGFGRIFAVRNPGAPDGLLPHPSPRYDLVRLANRMFTEAEANEDPSDLPAAYVFLGQFVDHDITFDTVTSFNALAPDRDFQNARTADLDLDCVYGGGPERTPFLYNGPYLRVGAITVYGDDARRRHDLLRAPRPGNPVAVIGDPRNDENFVISNVQQAFIAFHNRMVDRILEERAEEARQLIARAGGNGGGESAYESTGRPVGQYGTAPGGSLAQLVASSINESGPRRESTGTQVDRQLVLEIAEENGLVSEILDEAREATIHHYHRMLAEDFIPRLIGIRRTQDILENGRDFYFPNGFRNLDGTTVEPFIPLEFAAAGYRFMHSMVPGRLTIRAGNNGEVIADIFGGGQSDPNVLTPRGFTPTRTDQGSLAIDWNRLAPIHGSPSIVTRARRIDPLLANPLSQLVAAGIVGAGGQGNLAARNLSRGRTYLLPAGQTLAQVILAKLEERGVLGTIYPGGRSAADYILPADDVTKESLAINVTPLWYYVLQEASEYGASFDSNVRRESAGGATASAADIGMMGLPDTVALTAGAQRESARGGGGTRMGGATLGPVGATIVGEVLLGLIDYHRETTGLGIDLNTTFDYQDLGYNSPPIAEGDLPAMTETVVSAGGQSFGRRYLLRNFLHDAGVSTPVDEADVCPGVATRQEDGC